MSILRFSLYASFTIILTGVLLSIFEDPRAILNEITFESPQDTRAYAIAKNGSSQYFDAKGNLSYSVQSSKLSHFRPHDDELNSYTLAEQAHIEIFHDDSPWKIDAKLARVSHDQHITLYDDVNILGQDMNGEVTHMTTEELSFDPSQKLAQTDKTVTIRSRFGEIKAQGMIADLNSRKIKLLRKVRGVHHPETLIQ